ncbi:hypothetical protein GBAR_LOCUS5716 [Geodia barretti]|uniref:Uncharacterized protein n=1 Tax=Geodia barretti TaxID=519541 RepID=A0AA35RBD8_GEOBA|nr:hypothetical protein GBAR_LOCUS5716 [Geodia barretti]
MALTEGGPGQERWREQGSTPPYESIISVLPSQVHNKSDTLPLYFTTHRVPHYTCHPPSGHIPPSHTLTLSLTFTPKQLGPLNARLLIDILTSDSRSGKEGGVVKTMVVDLRGEGGTLLPYEKRKLELTFAPRRDYTLYLRFLAVDTNREATASGGDLEVAVCATALPVDVQLEPSPPLQFGATPTMSPTTQHVKYSRVCISIGPQQVRHTSSYFTTHRVLHFTCHPPSGHIHLTHLSLSLTFTPKQLGPLNARLLIDILTSGLQSIT